MSDLLWLLVPLAIVAVLVDIFTREQPRYQPPKPGTVSDPDVAAMEKRQRLHGESLRKQGKTLLAPLQGGLPRGHGKSYRPALTMKQPDVVAPKANKVVPIRRSK